MDAVPDAATRAELRALLWREIGYAPPEEELELVAGRQAGWQPLLALLRELPAEREPWLPPCADAGEDARR